MLLGIKPTTAGVDQQLTTHERGFHHYLMFAPKKRICFYHYKLYVCMRGLVHVNYLSLPYFHNTFTLIYYKNITIHQIIYIHPSYQHTQKKENIK